MKVAALVNCHDFPELVIDTIESIKTWVTRDIGVIIDAPGWNKFSFIHWGNVKPFRGLHHNFHKSPYRNITYGLKKIYELFPDYDWYVYVEYDCIFTSDAYLKDLANKHYISCLANDIRYQRDFILPILNKIVGANISDFATMLGCCVFYSGAFIKRLYDTNFYDNLLSATETFQNGFFPDYKQYAFEETLFPTMVKYHGGTVYELGAWRRNAWTNNKYPMRFRPDITIKDLPADASIVHPLKKLVDCPVRTKFKIARGKYLSWNKISIDKHDNFVQGSKLQYIICGTGRCGTVFMAALFNSIGISCGHERIFRNDGCSYKNYGYNSDSSSWAKLKQVDDPNVSLDAEASYMAVPYLTDEFLSGARVIHVIRKPIDVINSFVNGLGYFQYRDQQPDSPYEKFILKHVPDLIEITHPLLKAAYFYVKWNNMIESIKENMPYFIFCVEGNVNALLGVLGKSGVNHYNNIKCNSVIENNLLSMDDIPESPIKKDLLNMQRRYYR